jgi:hypothetical protein
MDELLKEIESGNSKHQGGGRLPLWSVQKLVADDHP